MQCGYSRSPFSFSMSSDHECVQGFSTFGGEGKLESFQEEEVFPMVLRKQEELRIPIDAVPEQLRARIGAESLEGCDSPSPKQRCPCLLLICCPFWHF